MSTQTVPPPGVFATLPWDRKPNPARQRVLSALRKLDAMIDREPLFTAEFHKYVNQRNQLATYLTSREW